MNKKAGILFVIFMCLFSCKEAKDYYHLPTYSSNNIIQAVIEIPAGTNKKYEYNSQSNTFEIDKKNGVERVIQFLPYPGNYGYIPSTYSNPEKGGDGDALDVLVLSESVFTGTVIEIIPIGVLKLIDDGEIDSKIIAIPANSKMQIIKVKTYQEFLIKYPEAKSIIESWFLNYNKEDPASINGWGNEQEALLEIENSKL